MAGESRKSFLLRMDPALWAQLESWAQEDLRSVNGQIEFLLRLAVSQRRNRPSPPPPEWTEGPPPSEPA